MSAPVTPTTRNLLLRKSEVEQFKVCPLCGALNVRENDECFVCTWKGAFDHHPVTVHLRLAEIIRHCPELYGLWDRAALPKPLRLVCAAFATLRQGIARLRASWQPVARPLWPKRRRRPFSIKA